MIAESRPRVAAWRRPARRLSAGPVAAFCALLVLTVLFSLPTIWLVLTSLKRETEYASYPITVLPAVAQPGNYLAAVTIFPYLTFFWNSVVLAGSYTVLTVLSAATRAP